MEYITTDLERHIVQIRGQLQELFDAIRQLITPASRPRRKIGFKPS